MRFVDICLKRIAYILSLADYDLVPFRMKLWSVCWINFLLFHRLRMYSDDVKCLIKSIAFKLLKENNNMTNYVVNRIAHHADISKNTIRNIITDKHSNSDAKRTERKKEAPKNWRIGPRHSGSCHTMHASFQRSCYFVEAETTPNWSKIIIKLWFSSWQLSIEL